MVSLLPRSSKSKSAAVEGQRFVDVAHLQRDVIEAHGAGLPRIGHYNLLRPSMTVLSREAGMVKLDAKSGTIGFDEPFAAEHFVDFPWSAVRLGIPVLINDT